MKFSLVAKGKRAERGSTLQVGIDKDRNPILLPVLLRPLTASEEIDADGDAVRISKEKGADANGSTQIFGMARMAAVLLRGVVDPDSPADSRTQTFDGGLSQVLELDPDTLASLYEQHQMHQEQVSPTFRSVSPARLFDLAKRLAEDEHDPLEFARYPRDTQWKLARFMAVLLRNAHFFSSSPGGSATSPATRSSEESSPSPSEASPTSPTTSKPTPDGETTP